MRQLVRLTGIGLALFLLAACSNVLPTRQQFEPAADDFANRLRWKDYSGASRHYTAEGRHEFIEQLMPRQDLQITDVQVQSAEPMPDGRIMTWSLVEYYELPSTTVRTFRLRQEWAYLEEGKAGLGSWRIVTPFPSFPPEPDRSGQ